MRSIIGSYSDPLLPVVAGVLAVTVAETVLLASVSGECIKGGSAKQALLTHVQNAGTDIVSRRL